MRKLALVALFGLVSFGANAANKLENIEAHKVITFDSCVNKKETHNCEAAMVYNTAFAAHNLKSFMHLKQLERQCHGVGISGLDERLLACQLASAIYENKLGR